jgi:hypothetical protein
MPGVPGLGALEGLLPNAELVQQMFVYQILGQIITGALAPLVQELSNLVWPIDPDVPLSAADLADMVMRAHIDLAAAQAMAKQTWISPDNLQLLIDNVGMPPAPTQLAEAYHRGFIPESGSGATVVSLEQGIRESRTSDKWIPVIKDLMVQVIPAAQAVQAWVRGQITPDEARKILLDNGFDAASAQIMFNTTGNPPSPTQLIELYRRGFIPMRGTGPDVTSVQQGIYEGDAKDKWEPLYEKLADYLPPPRTVTALERAGSITVAEAQTLYQQAGLSSSLAAAYSKNATAAKVAAAKQLAESVVLTLYESHQIDASQADQFLADLGYNATEAHYIESVYDLKREQTLLNQAISRIGTLFVSRKIDQATATTALQELQLPAPAITYHLQLWALEQSNTTRLLSESQIADSYKYGILDQETAQAELVALGYTPYDAWALLSVTMHAAQPNPPAKGPAPSGNIT